MPSIYSEVLYSQPPFNCSSNLFSSTTSICGLYGNQILIQGTTMSSFTDAYDFTITLQSIVNPATVVNCDGSYSSAQITYFQISMVNLATN